MAGNTYTKDKKSDMHRLVDLFAYFNSFGDPSCSHRDGIQEKSWIDVNNNWLGYVLLEEKIPWEYLYLNSEDYHTYLIPSRSPQNDMYYVGHYTRYPYKSRNNFYRFYQSDNVFLKSLSESLATAVNTRAKYTTGPSRFNDPQIHYFLLNVLDFYEKNDAARGYHHE